MAQAIHILSPNIAIATLNIRDGRGLGLAQAIQELECGGFDNMLLMDTKIQTEVYCHNRLGCNFTCLAARPPSAGEAKGGVGMVTREWPDGWGV